MTDAMALAMVAATPSVLRLLIDLRATRNWNHRPHNNPSQSASDKAVSLLLCVHNDLDHLKAIWPLWRGQVFPSDWDAEWIVVNDGSSDGTRLWLEQQRRSDPKALVVVHHEKTQPGKKAALTAGITVAHHDRLVLTDADCRPGENWAYSMASSIGNIPEGPAILLGFSLPNGGPWLLHFDAVRIAWQYGTAAAMGRSYMGVGRNLAYRKSLWKTLDGFQNHLDLASGDDDLFVQSAAQKGHAIRTFATQDPRMANPTVPASGWADGLRRKRRHLSTTSRYTPRILSNLVLDAWLDPLVAMGAAMGASGLLHNEGWIPALSAGLVLLFRAVNLSSFVKDLGIPAKHGFRAIFLGPMRWGFLAVATLLNFTSSPTWTQRAPTSRS